MSVGATGRKLASTPPRDRRRLEDVSVVVPTLGRPTLEGCLESILQGSAWPRKLLIVDQGSNPEVERWAERLRSAGLDTDHLRLEQKGIPIAMNSGLARVRTELVAVTHDDCRVERDWLEALARRVRESPDAILTGRVEPGGEGVVLCINTSRVPTTYRRPRLVKDVLFPANMGFRMATYERVGPFDESELFRRAAEDNDWGYRALRQGIPIVYAPEVVVYHLDWRDKEKRIATYRVYARSQGAFFGKHLGKGRWIFALRAAGDLLRGARRLLYALLRWDGELLASGLATLSRMPPGIIAGLRYSRAGRTGRQSEGEPGA